MALPVGVLTAVVRFGPMIDDQGVPFAGKVTFTASRPKVWAVTGTPIMPRALTVTLDETGQGEIVLPATDQDGFTDGAGNAVKDWTYRVQIDLAGRGSDTRSFQVPTAGQPDVVMDLDLLTPVPSSTGVVVAQPSVLNVAGLTGGVTASALAAALAPELPIPDAAPRYAVPSPRLVVDGDSITLGATTNNVNGSGNQDRAKAWPTYMEQASDGRVNLVYNAAVSGQRSDQMLTRFDTIVAPLAPSVVLATAGTNDLGQGVPMETWLANMEAYRAKVAAIGATLIVGTVYPTSSNSPEGRSAAVPVWNAALRTWAEANAVRVVGFDAFTDPITKGWPTGWSTDAIHPTQGDAPQQIGVFAWEAVADLFGPQVVGTARRFGAGGLDNGLFDGATNLAAPNATVAPTVGTGTLPAGTYSYRVSTRAYMGESALSAPAGVVLSGTGQVTVTIPAVTGNRGYRVYRRGPADFDWRLIGTPASSASAVTFVDDGTATPGDAATGVDTSWQPTAASLVQNSNFRIGGGLFTDETVRGRVLRLRTREDTGAENGFLLTGPASVAGGATPGDVWELSGLVRGDGRNPGMVRVRLRSGTTQVALIKAFDDVPLPGRQWGRFHLRYTIPVGVDNSVPLLTVGPKLGADEGYLEFAELRLVKVA